MGISAVSGVRRPELCNCRTGQVVGCQNCAIVAVEWPSARPGSELCNCRTGQVVGCQNCATVAQEWRSDPTEGQNPSSMYLSIHHGPFIYLYIHSSIRSSIHRSVYSSILPFTHQSIHLSIYPECPSFRSAMYLSMHVSIIWYRGCSAPHGKVSGRLLYAFTH